MTDTERAASLSKLAAAVESSRQLEADARVKKHSMSPAERKLHGARGTLRSAAFTLTRAQAALATAMRAHEQALDEMEAAQADFTLREAQVAAEKGGDSPAPAEA